MVGTKTKSGDFSAGEWPVSGGVDSSSESACSYTELVITGHQDGSVRFWDASSTSMQSLHRIKTAKYFERAKGGEAGQEADEDPYAVKQLELCGESKDLAVAGAAGQVLLFRFRRKETATETKSMEIPIVYEVSSAQQQAKMAAAAARAAGGEGAECASPSGQQHFEFPAPKPLLNVASQSAAYTDPVDGFNFDKPQYEYFSPLKVRPGAQRKTPGFHAELACLTPWVNGEKPSPVACLALNSSYGLMAYGNGAGLAVIDYEQGVCLLNMGSADLYGSLDPFQRLPKSPKPLDLSSRPEIVKVDLAGYNQVSASTDSPTPGGKEGAEKEKLVQKDSVAPSKAGERVRSPDPRRLQKGGSSTDENNLSKSSSNSSLADGVVATEGITCLHFADAFTSKNDFTLSASLQVGTSLGSVITVVVTLPDSSAEARKTEPVVVSPSGTLYRMRGKVLAMRFLDASSGCLLSRGRPAENVKVPAKSSHSHSAAATTPNLASVGGQGSQDKSSPPPSAPGSGGGSSSSGDQEVMLVCTDKTAAVYALPSQRQMYSQTIDESSSVVRAAITNFGGSRYSPCLACYTSCGMVKVYSLPSLRPLCDGYLVSSSDRVESTLTFSDYGHGLYFYNQNELQKFTISKSFCRQLPEMQGTVFQVCTKK